MLHECEIFLMKPVSQVVSNCAEVSDFCMGSPLCLSKSGDLPRPAVDMPKRALHNCFFNFKEAIKFISFQSVHIIQFKLLPIVNQHPNGLIPKPKPSAHFLKGQSRFRLTVLSVCRCSPLPHFSMSCALSQEESVDDESLSSSQQSAWPPRPRRCVSSSSSSSPEQLRGGRNSMCLIML